MKTKVITVATMMLPGLERLKESCENFGIDLEVLGMDTQWKGFGTKILLTKEYLEKLEGYTHFIFIDAYDVLFINTLKNIEREYNLFYPDKIVFSAEKGCWPDAGLAGSYPETDSEWKYLNSGSYMAPIQPFLELLNQYPVKYQEDDQLYFTKIFLNSDKIVLDVNCDLFQSVAFEVEGDLKVAKTKVINNKRFSFPMIIHGNGKTPLDKFLPLIKNNMDSVNYVKNIWQDKADTHKLIHETFLQKVNEFPELKAHRDFVEQNVHGFGERSFLWLWWLVVEQMPSEFSFLEIGVFKGAILSLIKLIANLQGKTVTRYGVTPLSTEGGVWESDYLKDIERIHDVFNLKKDYTIIQGLSEDPEIIKKAQELKVDILYIDGGHEERHITNDVDNYVPILNKDGYLVIDDCANGFHMPWGYFQGIAEVSRVVEKKLPPFAKNENFEFMFNVVHNMVFKKIK